MNKNIQISYKRSWAKVVQNQEINQQGSSDDSYDQRMSHQASINSQRQEDQFWETSSFINQSPFQFINPNTIQNQTQEFKSQQFQHLSKEINNNACNIKNNQQQLAVSTNLNWKFMEQEVLFTSYANPFNMESERICKIQYQDQKNQLWDAKYSQKESKKTKSENTSEKSQNQQLQSYFIENHQNMQIE